MTGNLQFKRGLKSNLPTSAPSGMPLWCTDTKELYVGTETGVIKVGSNSSTQTGGTDTDFSEILLPYEKINKQIIFPTAEPTSSRIDDEIDIDENDVPLLRVPSIDTDPIGGISYDYLAYTLTDNSIHRINISEKSSFILPKITDHTIFHQILVQVTLENVVSINLGTSVYFDQQEPKMSFTGNYNLLYEHDGTNWVVGCVRKV